MKKQTQILSVMSAAAFLALVQTPAGPAGLAYASDCGWTEENGAMVYYDEDGDLLTDTWHKEGNDWFYLNENGQITKEQKIDDYYLGTDGRMVRNAWVELTNDDDMDSPESPESYWYYFDEDGKAVTSNWLKQDGKFYYFDEDGHMLSGKTEIDGSYYYLGEEHDGSMKTGWILLEEHASNPDSGENWHYFNPNGKMTETQYDKKINGNYYTFIDGSMQTGWVRMPMEPAETAGGSAPATDSNAENPGETAPSISDYQYYGPEGDGKRASGWHTIEGVSGIHDTDETYTFYFRGGKALHSANEGNSLFTVDGKKYAFNHRGELQNGLQMITLDNGETASFFFGEDGAMKTGKQKIHNEETGEDENWFFYTEGEKRGQGYHGLRDNILYVNGKRCEASSDLKYAPAALDGVTYLVNTSGAIQKASAASTSSAKPELGRGHKDYKDAGGHIWTVDTNGIIH